EWVPNQYGGNENLEAIAFFRKLNTAVFAEFPDVLMIAEESTAWAKVTTPAAEGGLGFNFKWNMGWANDLFDYVATDPIYRSHKHEKLTFSMMYAFSENFILPVSHDEVVHGKKSLLDKMYGSYEQKFAGMRVFLAYMMTHPGKKMLFMGSEYGPFREWDYENQLEWFMLDFEKHRLLRHYTASLNRFYLETPALWEIDNSWDGFAWINPDDRDNNVISFRRFDRRGGELVVLLNFGPVRRNGYSVCIRDGAAAYVPIFNSDETAFGGEGSVFSARIVTSPGEDGAWLTLDLPPLSAVFLSPWSAPSVRAAGPAIQSSKKNQ
ncbi:MAG: alpha amylase C-terminal domain-containing protein, partial [Clostridia bacterium]|nr:alpha amylase C-terminal domain-containing protein [Clostridia bacterium]